jgi:threonine/homoserine/homoserine lactone efflux protein
LAYIRRYAISMRLEPIVAFTLFSIVTAVTPGPNNVMLTATGANVGIRRGMPHLLGVIVGFGVMQFIVIGGAGTLLTTLPPLLNALKVIGIAVLLWLSWKIATAGRSGAVRERPIGFFGAVAFQPLNPKAWLICASAVSYLQPDANALLQSAIFGAIWVVIGIPCMFVWLAFGAAMQRVLRTDRALRIFNVAMGLLLAATVPLLL